MWRLSPAELAILLIAVAIYLINPNWTVLRHAETRFRSGVGAGLDVGGWFGRSGEKAKLEARVKAYETELEQTRAELRTLSLQILENDALRALFLLPKRREYRYLFGEVVGRSIRPTEARLTVRVPESSSSAVAPTGSPVVASALPEWIAIGQVIDVKNDLVEVMLLSDPRSRIGVTSADTPAYGSALLIGGGMDRMELDFAAHPHFTKALAPHVRLVTSPESRFPPGLGAAELKPIVGSGDAPVRFQPVPIRPYGELQFVVILVPAGNP